MSDPDGNNGLGVIHWVAYDIPPSKTSLSEGEASESPKTWVGGKNVTGSDHYFGAMRAGGARPSSLRHYGDCDRYPAGHAHARAPSRGAGATTSGACPCAGQYRRALYSPLVLSPLAHGPQFYVGPPSNRATIPSQ
jgi:hypothetical protein